jgi:signal transduction histidine kinase
MSLRATLRFDGSGFPASKPKDLTLATMAERVRALGGACTIRSTASKGATIRIDIPIKHAPAKVDDLELVESRS